MKKNILLAVLFLNFAAVTAGDAGIPVAPPAPPLTGGVKPPVIPVAPTPPTTPKSPTPDGGTPAGGIPVAPTPPVAPKPPIVTPPVAPKPPVVTPVTPKTPVVDPVVSAGDLKDNLSVLAQALSGVVENLTASVDDGSTPKLADYIDAERIGKLGDFSDAVLALRQAIVVAGKPKFEDKEQLLKALSNAGFNLSTKAGARKAQEDRLNLSLPTLVKSK